MVCSRANFTPHTVMDKMQSCSDVSSGDPAGRRAPWVRLPKMYLIQKIVVPSFALYCVPCYEILV